MPNHCVKAGGGVNPLAVIIATKNRAEAIERYALTSLAQSEFRDFVCIVWDASDDDSTQKVVESRDWGFSPEYFRAPRLGSASQRNDAVMYVIANYPDVHFVLYIDDDSEVSPDALGGVLETFEVTKVDCVNMVRYRISGSQVRFATRLRHLLGMRRQGATDFLYNYGAFEAMPGAKAEWAAGCGMAFRIEIFHDEKYFFPEPFQRFGGYALDEDVAFSLFLHKKMGKRIINSIAGHYIHYSASGGRLDIEKFTAAKWYNLHLLFEALYNDVHGLKKAWLVMKFKSFIYGASLIKHYFGLSFNNIHAILCGIAEAKAALKEFHQHSDVRKLFQYGVGKGWTD